jgi:hypothetical protein
MTYLRRDRRQNLKSGGKSHTYQIKDCHYVDPLVGVEDLQQHSQRCSQQTSHEPLRSGEIQRDHTLVGKSRIVPRQ